MRFPRSFGQGRKCWDISKRCGSETSEPVRNATNICSSHHTHARTHARPQERKCGDLSGWIQECGCVIELENWFFFFKLVNPASNVSGRITDCFVQRTVSESMLFLSSILVMVIWTCKKNQCLCPSYSVGQKRSIESCQYISKRKS